MFFIVISHYTRPVAQIDATLAAHVTYVEAQFRRGVFLLSGPKEPRDGSIIAAQAESAEALRAVLELDPFRQQGLIDYTITQWNLNRRASNLSDVALSTITAL
jgi:uncharacterized protein YciI